MPIESLPNVDFRRIPRELEGLWVVLRLGDDQAIMGQGATPQEAVLQSGTDPDDPRFALTQVPDFRLGIARIKFAPWLNVRR